MNIIEALKQNETQPVRRVDNDFVYWKGDMKHYNEFSYEEVTAEWTVLCDSIHIPLDEFVKIYNDLHPCNGDSRLLCSFLRRIGV